MVVMIRQITLFFTILTLSVLFWQQHNAFCSPVSQEIKRIITNETLPSSFLDSGLETEHMQRLYAFMDFIPLWHDSRGQPTDRAGTYLNILQEAWQEGLNPEAYGIEKIKNYLRFKKGFLTPAQADLFISAALLTYIRDVKTGRIAPHKIDPELFMPVKDIDFVYLLFEALRSEDPVKYFSHLPPQHAEYQRLKEELIRLENLRKKGINKDLQALETEEILIKPGETSVKIAIIRKHLEKEKALLPPEHGNGGLYDTQMEAVIKSQQRSSGLLADGVIGPATVKMLQNGYDDKINKIKLSMERWRWLPEDLGEKHLRVNIAGFTVDAYKNTEKVFSMPIIVGTITKRTPVFSTVMPSVTFAPYWNVPDSIAGDTILPKIQENPSYYHEAGFEMIRHIGGERILIDASHFDWQSISADDFPPFRFRQKPGPQNGLGPIRFNLVNDMSIFLHGTPNKELFNRAERNVSSGCVRLKDPLQMAHFILEDSQAINKNQINSFYNKAMEGDEGVASHTVALDKKIPVHIVYWTSWIDSDNSVRYANDIYGRDALLTQALTGRIQGVK